MLKRRINTIEVMNNDYPQAHIETPHTNEHLASVSIFVPVEVCMYIIALARYVGKGGIRLLPPPRAPARFTLDRIDFLRLSLFCCSSTFFGSEFILDRIDFRTLRKYPPGKFQCAHVW